MPTHFRRFRVLNDDKNGNNNSVEEATFLLPPPRGATVIGSGTEFPSLPPGLWAEREFGPEEFQGTRMVVTLRLSDGTGIENWEIQVVSNGVPLHLHSVDIEVFENNAGDMRAKAQIAADEYVFLEETRAF